MPSELLEEPEREHRVTRCFYWCREGDSNPHEDLSSADFKNCSGTIWPGFGGVACRPFSGYMLNKNSMLDNCRSFPLRDGRTPSHRPGLAHSWHTSGGPGGAGFLAGDQLGHTKAEGVSLWSAGSRRGRGRDGRQGMACRQISTRHGLR